LIKKLFLEFKDVQAFDDSKKHSTEYLCKVYGISTKNNVDPSALITKYRNELTQLGMKLITENPQFANMYYLVFAGLLKENK
jgi:hypothetical protein